MGTQKDKKLIILSCLFVATCALVYLGVESSKVYAKPSLRSYFQQIEGYALQGKIDLSQRAHEMLDVDDYAFFDFSGKDGKVNLYVGYYATAEKAYAAHSPLVCYPSSGWTITKKSTFHTLQVGDYSVNYEEISTAYGEAKELVLFWYQTHEMSSTKVYKNKIHMGYNKLTKNDEQYSFLRVAVPFGDRPYNDVKKAATDFINVFYPQMVQYFSIKGEEIKKK